MAGGIVKWTFVNTDRFSKPTKKMTESLRRMRRELGAVGQASDRVNRKTAQTSKGFLSLGRNIGVGLTGAAAIAGARKAVRGYADMETGILNVLSLVTDADEKVRLKPIFERMVKDAGKLGIGVQEATSALFDQVSQAGFSEESLGAYTGAMELAIGGNAQFADSVSVINKMLENFPELAGNAQKAANFLFTGQVFGSTNVQQLSTTLPEIAGSFAAFGGNLAQLVGAVSLSTKRLGGTASAAIAFQRFVDTFNATKGTAQFKALRRANLPTNAIQFRDEGGLPTVLAKIAELQKTDAGRLKIQAVFGERVRALKFANVIDEKFASELAQLVDVMGDNFESGEGLRRSFDDISKSTSTGMSAASESFNEMWRIIGKQMAPALLKFSQAMIRFMERVEARGGGVGGLIQELVSTAGKEAVGSFTTRGDKLISALSNQVGVGPFFTALQHARSAVPSPLASVDIRVSSDAGSNVSSVSSTSDPGLDVGVQGR